MDSIHNRSWSRVSPCVHLQLKLQPDEEKSAFVRSGRTSGCETNTRPQGFPDGRPQRLICSRTMRGKPGEQWEQELYASSFSSAAMLEDLELFGQSEGNNSSAKTSIIHPSSLLSFLRYPGLPQPSDLLLRHQVAVCSRGPY